jgi:hypothetical protein
MKTHVVFRSNAFPPYDGEEEEINPGRYGKRLAEFLVDGLKQKGSSRWTQLPKIGAGWCPSKTMASVYAVEDSLRNRSVMDDSQMSPEIAWLVRA